MTKRKAALKIPDVMQTAAALRGEALEAEPESPTVTPKQERPVTTAVYLPKRTYDLLKRVAYKRSAATLTKPSVSKLITELAERYRGELEEELMK